MLDTNEKVRLYDSFDTNHDGHITADEIAELLSKWATTPLPPEQQSELRTRIAEACGEVVPLEKFIANFMQIFGVSLSKPNRIKGVARTMWPGGDDDDDDEKQPMMLDASEKADAGTVPEEVRRRTSKDNTVEI